MYYVDIIRFEVRCSVLEVRVRFMKLDLRFGFSEFGIFAFVPTLIGGSLDISKHQRCQKYIDYLLLKVDLECIFI